MKKLNCRQRALSALCLIMLSSCSSKTCREWDVQTNITKCPLYSSGRLILSPESDQTNIELEIVRSYSGLRMYINILFLQAQPLPDDPSRTKAEIYFEGEDEPWTIYPFILEGGQRLLLPDDVAEYLLSVLEAGSTFQIKIGRYQTAIITDSFDKAYAELLKVSIM